MRAYAFAGIIHTGIMKKPNHASACPAAPARRVCSPYPEIGMCLPKLGCASRNWDVPPEIGT